MEPLAKIERERFLKLCTLSEMEEICGGDLTGTLKVRYRQLREKGVGAFVKHAPWNRLASTSFSLDCIICFCMYYTCEHVLIVLYLFIVVSTALNKQ